MNKAKVKAWAVLLSIPMILTTLGVIFPDVGRALISTILSLTAMVVVIALAFTLAYIIINAIDTIRGNDN